MESLKRIMYCIKVIIKTEDEGYPMYNVTYHYLVQAVPVTEPIKLNDSIYNKVSFPKTAIRYLDIISTDEINADDSDFEEYMYLYRTKDIKLFYTKDIVTYQLNEVHNNK